MNPTTHWATTVRILTQLSRDRRAMFMILVIPALITVLFYSTLSLQGPGADGRHRTTGSASSRSPSSRAR